MQVKWNNMKNPYRKKGEKEEKEVNLAKDQECWVFTDGSEKDGKVGNGVTPIFFINIFIFSSILIVTQK